MSWLGFTAHAVERHKPFLSEIGYRSFFGVGGALQAEYTPDSFTIAIVESHVRAALKEKLVRIR